MAMIIEEMPEEDGNDNDEVDLPLRQQRQEVTYYLFLEDILAKKFYANYSRTPSDSKSVGSSAIGFDENAVETLTYHSLSSYRMNQQRKDEFDVMILTNLQLIHVSLIWLPDDEERKVS
ncbi:hypothetical protein QE152_g36754 [Popillia japonica]|uniref:Uncharacterized protein n=1 Tax=Popillia japonica TaxID=7064 RepID=A0AAW1IBP8_POPJA